MGIQWAVDCIIDAIWIESHMGGRGLAHLETGKDTSLLMFRHCWYPLQKT
jgi:hypothetical protein